MRRFLKLEVVAKKTGKELLNIDVKKDKNQLAEEDVVVGAKTERLLKNLSPHVQKRERGNMRKFFIAVTRYLQKKLPIADNLLISAACLNPDNRKTKHSVRSIKCLAKHFPHVVTENEISIVTDEWKLYQLESEENLTHQDGRIDHYWWNVFKIKTMSGDIKYPLLSKLVKSVLSLPHGNSAVERSLSHNKNTVTDVRTELLDQTITALRRMKEYARSKGGAENIIITPRMVELVREAKKKDDERIAKERKKKELSEQKLLEKESKEEEAEKRFKKCEKSKISLEEAEESFKKKEDELDNDLKLAQKAIEYASTSLKSALESKDILGMQVAQELLESSTKKLESLTQNREKQSKQRDKLGEKRKNTIENLFRNVKKNKK